MRVAGYDPVVSDHLRGSPVYGGINEELKGVPLGRDVGVVAMVLMLVLAVRLLLLMMLMRRLWLMVLLFMLSMKMIHLVAASGVTSVRPHRN